MIDEIVISSGLRETRIALLAAGRLQELEIRHAADDTYLGRVYLARVGRIVPGMQAAFIEFGAARSGFLAARDVRHGVRENAPPPGDEAAISELLQEGQAILVQVVKEPIADKGARLTMDLTLPGRYLAFRPFRLGTSLSRRIEDEAERARLLALGDTIAGEEGGFILRTAAEGADGETLQAEAHQIRDLWRRIKDRAGGAEAPALLHRDDDPVIRSLRDHLYPDVEQVLFDNVDALSRARDYAAEALPWAHDRLLLCDSDEALFERHDIEADIEAALEARVALPGGGSISIESTEALTAIDVNSGRFMDGRDPEETALATNLEAAAEIARQLRLRAIGGIIVIDFIHMNGPGNVAQVLSTFDAALAEDKAPTRRSEMSAFGLLEMTRRRVREPLAALLTEPCVHCYGQERRLTARAIADHLLRRAEREARASKGGRMYIAAAPEVVEDLHDGAEGFEDVLAHHLGCRVVLDPDPTRPRESFDIAWE